MTLALVKNFIALKNLSLNQLRDASGEDNRISKCFLHSSNQNSPEGIGSEHSCCGRNVIIVPQSILISSDTTREIVAMPNTHAVKRLLCMSEVQYRLVQMGGYRLLPLHPIQ